MYDLISADKIIIVTTVADGDRKTRIAQERECVCVRDSEREVGREREGGASKERREGGKERENIGGQIAIVIEPDNDGGGN